MCFKSYIRSTQLFKPYVISCNTLFWSPVGKRPSEIRNKNWLESTSYLLTLCLMFNFESVSYWSWKNSLFVIQKIFKILKFYRQWKNGRSSKYRLGRCISFKFKLDFDWTPYPEESEGEVSREDIEFMFEPNLEQVREPTVSNLQFCLNPFTSPQFQ